MKPHNAISRQLDRIEQKVNELLCKFIAHNIVVLIHEMHELGVSPSFCTQSPITAPNVGGG